MDRSRTCVDVTPRQFSFGYRTFFPNDCGRLGSYRAKPFL
jgi:hypothetical protein